MLSDQDFIWIKKVEGILKVVVPVATIPLAPCATI